MAKVTNLNRFRKEKARAEARLKGDANAASHGRSKAEKDRAAAEADLAARRIDGHRRDECD